MAVTNWSRTRSADETKVATEPSCATGSNPPSPVAAARSRSDVAATPASNALGRVGGRHGAGQEHLARLGQTGGPERLQMGDQGQPAA